jgi:transcriptional regulator with XRE-family HTH domain
MTKTHADLLAQRGVDRARVDAIKALLANEMRAYRLRELRKELELTQEQVAVELGSSQRMVSKIESGQIDRAQVETLRRYVEAIGGTLKIEAQFGDTTLALA